MSTERISALSSPADRGDGKFRANVGAAPLTEEQTNAAVEALVNTSLVDSYPVLERQFVDPPLQHQRYGLISFVPSKGAVPDKDGFFGFVKLRGHFETVEEAQERAETLIKTVDSYHGINIYHVGRPVPITQDAKYSERTTKVDLKTKTVSTISEDVKQKREKERSDMEEMKRRQDELLNEAKPDFVQDPYETYTMLRVKKAQLTWTYEETRKKLELVKNAIISARAEIAKMDSENADYSTQHLQRYMDARRSAGIPDDRTTDDSYLKYLVEDVELPF